MQTSFMHPPFGFALFFLRSVAPKADYDDKLTGRRIKAVATSDIYWGAVPFVCLQIVMVALVIAFPGLVGDFSVKQHNLENIQMNIEVPDYGGTEQLPPPGLGEDGAATDLQRQLEEQFRK
jgi:hypothetical protein